VEELAVHEKAARELSLKLRLMEEENKDLKEKASSHPTWDYIFIYRG
jgi:hypothetical protein